MIILEFHRAVYRITILPDIMICCNLMSAVAWVAWRRKEQGIWVDSGRVGVGNHLLEHPVAKEIMETKEA